MSSIYDWKFEADKNGTADEDIILHDRQTADTFNNAFRVIMSRFRSYIQDTGVLHANIDYQIITLVDFQTNILIESYGKPTEYCDDLVLKFTVNAANVGDTRIVLNDLPPAKIYKASHQGIVPLEDEDIMPLGVYTVVYVASGDHVGFHLLNPIKHANKLEYDEYEYPTGMVSPFAGKDVPDGWLPCDGSEHPKHLYPALYALIGDRSWEYRDPNFRRTNPYMFHTPDFRGCFLSGAKDAEGHVFGFTNFPDIKSHIHPATETKDTYYQYFPMERKVENPRDIVDMSRSDLGFFRSTTYGMQEIFDESFYAKRRNAPSSRKKRFLDLFDLRALVDGSFKYFHDYYEAYVAKATIDRYINVKSKYIGEIDVRPVNVAITFGIKT